MSPAMKPFLEHVEPESGDLFSYEPDPTWAAHPYLWRVREASARPAEEVLQDDISQIRPGELLLIVSVQRPGSPRSPGAGGLSVFTRGGLHWMHLDPRIDRSLVRHLHLIGRPGSDP